MIEKVRLNIIGMSCASCVASVERGLKRVNGVLEAEVFLITNSAKVTFDSTICNIESLIKAVQNVGYDATLDSVLESDSTQSSHTESLQSEMSNLDNKDSMNLGNLQTQNIDASGFALSMTSKTHDMESKTQETNDLQNLDSKKDSSHTESLHDSHAFPPTLRGGQGGGTHLDSKKDSRHTERSEVSNLNSKDSMQNMPNCHDVNVAQMLKDSNSVDSTIPPPNPPRKGGGKVECLRKEGGGKEESLRKGGGSESATQSKIGSETAANEATTHIESANANIDASGFALNMTSKTHDMESTHAKDSMQNMPNCHDVNVAQMLKDSVDSQNIDASGFALSMTSKTHDMESKTQETNDLQNLDSKKDSCHTERSEVSNLDSKDSMQNMPNCHDVNVAQMLKNSVESPPPSPPRKGGGKAECLRKEGGSETATQSKIGNESVAQNKISSETTTNGVTSTTESKPQTQNLKQILTHIETQILTPKNRLILSAIFSAIILYISMFAMMFNAPLPTLLQNNTANALTQLFITLCVMHFGRDFYIKGIRALFFINPNMDSLVALGSLSGFLYSLYALVAGLFAHSINLHSLYFEGVCVIITFVMLGKFIEDNAKFKAMANAKKLLGRQEYKVYKVTNIITLEQENISIDSIKKGDYLNVLDHSFIPVDGILVSPNVANIDESVLSGESLPIAKTKGEIINAGSLNLESNIIIQALSSNKDSTLAKMKNLIINSYESKAKIAALADKISGFFVPSVILLALLSFAFWLNYENLEVAIKYFASTLLISCPCALGLATPMAILFANARANNMGVFFKDSKSLENISQCDYAIFDKTGTLTKRDFKLKEILLLDSTESKEEILKIIASVEKTSTHILAQSVCKAANNLNLYKIIESKNIINRGIKATLQIDSMKCEFIVGNATFMQENGLNVELVNGISIYVAQKIDDVYRIKGAIILEENLRDDAIELIKSLKSMGITCEILSGDNAANVERVAEVLNVSFKGGCTPNDKLEYIKTLQESGHKVLMIGDGTNDAMALSRANVSIVMSSGANLSLEYGDIIYFNNHLGAIKDSILLGRKALRNIKENLSFAFMYNAICIPIAMGVFASFGVSLNPMLASLAMSLSSISVVTNALRLYYVKLG